MKIGADGRAKATRRGLNKLYWLRNLLVRLRRFYLVRLWGMDICATANFSLSARFDRTFPIGVHVGDFSYVAFDAVILTHDRTRGLYLHTRIGRNCFVGARSIILPGVEIGDGSIVAAGAVVTRSFPPKTVIAGNPARSVRENVEVGPYGRLHVADKNEDRLARGGLT